MASPSLRHRHRHSHSHRPLPPSFNPFDENEHDQLSPSPSSNHRTSLSQSYNPFDSSSDENSPPSLAHTSSPPPPSHTSPSASHTSRHSNLHQSLTPRTFRDDYTASVDLLSDHLQHQEVVEEKDPALLLSEKTTKTVHSCVRIAEDIKSEATRTVINLHEQGEKMFRTHSVAMDMERNLTTGEKLLGSLGGIFSRTWRPRRSPSLRGPIVEAASYQVQKKDMVVQQQLIREDGKVRHHHHQSASNSCHSTGMMHGGCVQMERRKQEDALSDLSNILDQLKDMSTDMGLEISRQNASLDNFLNDTTILEDRVKTANAWGKRLLGRR